MPHMIRYTVNPGQLEEHERLLEHLFDELHHDAPPGLRYLTFREPDGVSFMHLISYDKAGHGALPHLNALRDFHKGLRERCELAPKRTELHQAGAYGLGEPAGR